MSKVKGIISSIPDPFAEEDEQETPDQDIS